MSSEKVSVFKRFIENKDRNAIIICVFIAFVFWLTNALSEDYTHDYSFEIDYQLQENVSFASAPRTSLEARLSGQGWELFKASVRRRFKYLPVTVVRPDITRTDLISALYEHLTDYDITVREVNADIINLDINMVITRQVPISFNRSVSCANGFVITDSLHCEPAVVTVTGPSSLIERLAPITVEDIPIEPLSGPFSIEAALDLPDLNYLTFERTTVNLVGSAERMVQVTSIKPVSLEDPESVFNLEQPTVSVTYKVGVSHADSSALEDIEVWVDPTEMPLDSGAVKVRLRDVPPYTIEVSVTPVELRYTRKK